jgi:hypothetical protein
LLRATAATPAVHDQALESLVLDLRMWAAAPQPTQRSLHALLLHLAATSPAPLRRLLSVPKLLYELQVSSSPQLICSSDLGSWGGGEWPLNERHNGHTGGCGLHVRRERLGVVPAEPTRQNGQPNHRVSVRV